MSENEYPYYDAKRGEITDFPPLSRKMQRVLRRQQKIVQENIRLAWEAADEAWDEIYDAQKHRQEP